MIKAFVTVIFVCLWSLNAQAQTAPSSFAATPLRIGTPLTFIVSHDGSNTTSYKVYDNDTLILERDKASVWNNGVVNLHLTGGLTTVGTHVISVAAVNETGEVKSATITLQVLAQIWSTILSSNRAIDWSSAGVDGDIPVRTSICATLSSDTTAAQINTAIANCGTGQVVKLNAGTYTLNDAIIFNNKSNVTLRGAGAAQTKLVFTNANPSVSCFGPNANICFKNGESNYSQGPVHTANWTAGYTKDTNTITLSSTTGLAVGNLLFLDQLDDSTDTGSIFVCVSSATCTYHDGNTFGRSGRTQSQIVHVENISGNTVTISPAIAMPNWASGKSPGAWWGDTSIKYSGLEDLTVDGTNGASGSANASIIFNNAVDCWVKNIRTINGPHAHIWLRWSAQITIRSIYLYGGQGSSSVNYGIEPAQTSGILVENSIFQHQTGPITINGADIGSVYAYNYAIDDNYTTPTSWMIPMFDMHNGGIAMDLFEGNQGLGLQADNVNGTHHFQTLFRNHFFGDIYNDPVKTGNTTVTNFWAFSRFYNVIGNVLGRTGYYDTYEVNLGSSPTAIYSLGEPDAGSPADPDSYVKTTLMRWGNYDTVNAISRFVSGEVPSGLSDYPNTVPSNQNLPTSFYLNMKPTWLSSVNWPSIGPDVVNGDISGFGGHAYKIPARRCYEDTSIDNAYGGANVRLFDPIVCYGQ